MRAAVAIASLLLALVADAQVKLRSDLRFTGPDGERGAVGLATPTSDSAAVTVAVAASGQAHWATVNWSLDTLVLQVEPEVVGYRDGLLLRFIPTSENQGATWMKVPGLPSHQVVRHDGSSIPRGSLRPDMVAEVLYANGAWTLLNSSSEQCPPGSLPVNGRLCMDMDAVDGLLFYAAVDHCMQRGGKLCSWDEYAVGCAVLGAQLNGLFDAWEWIDDASNHTHTANQAGRTTCQSQRSANVITTFPGDARCCYHPR